MSTERRPLFIHEGLVEQIEGVWRLIGSRCDECGDIRFPMALGCPVCHAGKSSLRAFPLSTRGSVFAFSRVMKAPPPFQGPYVLAWVQLPEGPRILAQLECAPDADVFGKPCELMIGKVWETATEMGTGFKFKLEAAA